MHTFSKNVESLSSASLAFWSYIIFGLKKMTTVMTEGGDCVYGDVEKFNQ